LKLAAGLKTSETSFTVAGLNEWVAAQYFKLEFGYIHYKIRL
jgi:hypothetical protein